MVDDSIKCKRRTKRLSVTNGRNDGKYNGIEYLPYNRMPRKVF